MAVRKVSMMRELTSCPFHPDSVVQLFCKDCSVALCPVCALCDHSKHSFVPVANEAKEMREQLEKSLTLANSAAQIVDREIVDGENIMKSNETSFQQAIHHRKV